MKNQTETETAQTQSAPLEIHKCIHGLNWFGDWLFERFYSLLEWNGMAFSNHIFIISK